MRGLCDRMLEQLIARFGSLPKELVVLLLAMLPVSELRGAIPVGILLFKLSYMKVLFWAILGNIVPVLPILLFFDKFEVLLRRSSVSNKFINMFLARAEKKSRSIQKMGPIGLALFVAVPLPVTGAWTGSLIAFLLGFPVMRSFGYIICGIFVAAGVVSVLTYSGVELVHVVNM